MLSIFEFIVRFKGLNFRCTTVSIFIPWSLICVLDFIIMSWTFIDTYTLNLMHIVMTFWSRVLLYLSTFQFDLFGPSICAGVCLRTNHFQEEGNDKNRGDFLNEQFNFPLGQLRRHELRRSRILNALQQFLLSSIICMNIDFFHYIFLWYLVYFQNLLRRCSSHSWFEFDFFYW